MYVIITTFVGLMYLFRVCIPFNWLHLVTFVVMVGIFVACYLVKAPIILEFFGIEHNVTPEMAKAMAAMASVLLFIYGVLSLTTRNVHRKIDASLNLRLKKKAAV